MGTAALRRMGNNLPRACGDPSVVKYIEFKIVDNNPKYDFGRKITPIISSFPFSWGRQF